MPRPHLARPGRPRAVSPHAATEKSYRIVVRGLATRAILGIHPHERRKRQDVLLDVALEVTSRAGATDRIGDAVDYKRIKDDVLDLVESSRYHLVEALADAVAELCLSHAAVRSADVTVDKPGALRFARSVAVQVRRERP